MDGKRGAPPDAWNCGRVCVQPALPSGACGKEGRGQRGRARSLQAPAVGARGGSSGGELCVASTYGAAYLTPADSALMSL